MTAITQTDVWPDGPLLAYVGDDFTGSTDVMEAFSGAGVPTVLFLKPPSDMWVRRFSEFRCVGLATDARCRPPEWMDLHLDKAFRTMREFRAPLLHYKVCSTFDSSPSIGSIGRAIDIGIKHMRGAWSPTIVGVPRLKRYQAFGNLFAAAPSGEVTRLDRHPMSRHPVTPMDQADLRDHLARQTSRPIELVDLTTLRSEDAADGCIRKVGLDHPVVLFDVIDDADLAKIGKVIWRQRGEGLFSASSSGLQYALAAHWRSIGLLPPSSALPSAAPAETILVVSGSCSVATAAQIAHARTDGFAALRLDIRRVLDDRTRENEIARIVDDAVGAHMDKRSPLIFSAEGPDDPAVLAFDDMARAARLSRSEAALATGAALAAIARRILDRQPSLRRVVVAGGDSSGAVAGGLEIAALTVDAGLSAGAPLCRAWSDHPEFDRLQIVLKGGQMGQADFFSRALSGGS